MLHTNKRTDHNVQRNDHNVKRKDYNDKQNDYNVKGTWQQGGFSGVFAEIGSA